MTESNNDHLTKCHDCGGYIPSKMAKRKETEGAHGKVSVPVCERCSGGEQ